VSPSGNESLWLFAEAVRPEPALRRRSADPHLDAARRLARRIGTLVDHSPEQVQTGQLICRHLLAMLRASEGDDPPDAPTPAH